MPLRSTSAAPVDQKFEKLEAIIQRNPVLQQAAGVISQDWIAKRRLGAVKLDPALTFVDLGHKESLRYLRRNLDRVADECGITRIDFGALLGPNRRFTQAIAAHFYELLDPDTDQPLFDGISYYSSLDLEWRCWAIFDKRFVPPAGAVTSIALDDPDLLKAARQLDLVIETGPNESE